MGRSRYLVLGLIVLLLAATVLLGRCDDARRLGDQAGEGGRTDKRVVYPRQQVSQNRPHGARSKRQAGHKTSSQDGQPASRPYNAVLALERAVLADKGGGAVFVEVNAIRHSPIVEKMLRCRNAEALAGMAEMKRELGIDPLEDLDRIALSDQVFAVSGQFGQLTLPPELGAPTRIAAGADLYRVDEPRPGAADGELVSHYLALVDQSLIIMGDDEPQVRAAIERAQGRQPSPPLQIEGSEGEIYGQIGAAFVQSMFDGASDPMSQRLREVVQGGLVRMTVDEQVALSLDVTATDQQTSDDLARTVAGALAAMRTEAARSGRDDVAGLLEQARVDPRDNGSFALDVAVPGDLVLRGMGCDDEGRPLYQPAAAAQSRPE